MKNNFAINIFDYKKIKKYTNNKASNKIIKSLKTNTKIDNGYLLSFTKALNKWAKDNGVCYYSPFFVSLNDNICEKHQTIFKTSNNKRVYGLSVFDLTKQEFDASSLPSGGLRNTSNAKGYALWDKISFPFIKDNILFIPSLFYSFNNDSLDNKNALIRSIQSLNTYGTKLLNKLGKKVKYITPFIGIEQEFFLIEKDIFEKRIDLKLTKRTLYGKSNIIKNNSYCNHIDTKALSFMNEINEKLHTFGVQCKTSHKESAPNQYEIVCQYDDANQTANNNDLILLLLKETANNYGFVCLLHEKPFASLSGSGKHNNYSIATNTQENLFKINKNNDKNIVFLSLLACLIKAIDENSSLILLSSCSYSNDLRLGQDEAPGNIVSLYLGPILTKVIDNIINDIPYQELLDDLKYVDFDRNRTSFITWTNDKFEFRGLGCSFDISFFNAVINTLLAKEFKEMIDLLNQNISILTIIKTYFKNHRNIIFNGNCYDLKIKQISTSNNLLCDKTIQTINILKNEKVIEMFGKFNIYNKKELDSRYKTIIDKYAEDIMLDINVYNILLNDYIYSFTYKQINRLSKVSNNLKNNNLDNTIINEKINKFNTMLIDLSLLIKNINTFTINEQNYDKKIEKINIYIYDISLKIKKIRSILEYLENHIDKDIWTLPTYKNIFY